MDMMSNIIVIEKPETILYEDVHNLLWIANEENRRNGFVLKTSELSGEELRVRLGEDGKCLVAMDGSRLVGTLFVYFATRSRWYYKGLIAEFGMIAIHPDYQGKHILRKLIELGIDYANDCGCLVIELDTADTNMRAINAYKHFGFSPVSYRANPGGDHYSVIMAKWLDKCPFSNWKVHYKYHLKKCYVKLRYKPDKEKRFGI